MPAGQPRVVHRFPGRPAGTESSSAIDHLMHAHGGFSPSALLGPGDAREYRAVTLVADEPAREADL